MCLAEQQQKKNCKARERRKVRGKPVITVCARGKCFFIMLMIYTNIRVTILIFIFIVSILLLNDMRQGRKKVQQPLWTLYSKTQRKGHDLFFSFFFSYSMGAHTKKNPWLCFTGGLLKRWVWQMGWEGHLLHVAQQGQVSMWELGLNEDRYQHHCWKLQG